MEPENQSEWEAPPPPEKIVTDPPQMSELATLGNIFFEPGKTFEDLKRKPRFLLAGLIVIIAASIFQIAFIQKVGFDRIIRERIESSSRTSQMSSEQKEKLIEQQSGPIVKAISYAAVPVILTIVFFLGGLIYWLGSNAMGGTGRYLGGVSAWVYSSFPPTLLFMVANLVVLLVKTVDEIDINNSQGGLVQANPSMFIDTKASPVLGALLSSIDLFAIWGWILAAIGLQTIFKISSGAAWAVVLIVGLCGVTAKVVWALFF